MASRIGDRLTPAGRRFVLWAVCSLLLAAGCATVPAAPPAPCLPPGLDTSIITSPLMVAQPFRIEVEGGGQVPGVYLRFQRGETPIALIYTPVGLIVVDMAPDDPNVPAWQNRRLVAPDGSIRRAPEGPCRWEQARIGA